MAARGSENGLISLLEHRDGRATDPELQKPAHSNRTIVYCGILEDCGRHIYTTPELMRINEVNCLSKTKERETLKHQEKDRQYSG